MKTMHELRNEGIRQKQVIERWSRKVKKRKEREREEKNENEERELGMRKQQRMRWFFSQREVYTLWGRSQATSDYSSKNKVEKSKKQKESGRCKAPSAIKRRNGTVSSCLYMHLLVPW